VPEDERVDPEVQLVHEVVLEQGLRKSAVAVDDDVVPVLELSSVTASTTSPKISAALFQSTERSVEEKTYLRMALIRSA